MSSCLDQQWMKFGSWGTEENIYLKKEGIVEKEVWLLYYFSFQMPREGILLSYEELQCRL